VLVSFISPFRADRDQARQRSGDDSTTQRSRFCEVYIDTPFDIAESRDPKGLYAKARRGELQNFTGIDSPYEPPEEPDVRVTPDMSPDDAAASIVRWLEQQGVLG
jgi:bifunctional enzyme CysN/CysC